MKGRCLGGPHDGKDFSATTPTVELLRYPEVSVPMDMNAEEAEKKFEPVRLGEYRYTPVWLWYPEETEDQKETMIQGP